MMKKSLFKPAEILFCPTTRCNLRCAHCDIKKHRGDLPVKTAVKFLDTCSAAGIRRVGFTGGEPFLVPGFLCAVSKEAVHRHMTFGRIMTNAVWFNTREKLTATLWKLFNSGYDGDLCVSVDAFHRQDLRKAALFIKTAVDIWGRPDIVSIAAVKGARDSITRRRLKKLKGLLGRDIFIKIFYIALSPVGKAGKLKSGWDGRWFKDDFCKGPGNVFFVLPDGTVKPCCGYANDAEMLTIGSIKHDTPQKLIKNARKNPFVRAVFGSGLHPIRKTLEKSGVRFPGKTTNHCLFCYYLTRYKLLGFLK